MRTGACAIRSGFCGGTPVTVRTNRGRVTRRCGGYKEGLLSYLEPDQVGSLAEDLGRRTEFVQWMTDLTGSHVVERLRNAGDHLKAGNAPARFAPAEGTEFFRPFGWEESAFYDLFVEAPRLGRDPLMNRVVRMGARLLPAEQRKKLERGIGIAVLRRTNG